MASPTESWPELPYEAWKDTYATLHMWTQIAGKIRLVQTPWLNHSWHVVLYVSPRGLTTSLIPYGNRSFELAFDFIDHVLVASTDDGAVRRIGLFPRTVADFYAELMATLAELGIEIRIDDMPNELPEPIRFSEDRTHAAYDPDFANRHWRLLATVEQVMFQFRTGFIGKSSPVHFFWGSFDLAVTRFSGRRAPLHPGGVPHLPDDVAQEAYSHEVSSAGFWPGNDMIPYPAFYSYAYPEPRRFCRRGRPPGRGVLQHRSQRIYSALRGGAPRRRPRACVDGFPDEHLRSRGFVGQMGPCRVGLPARRARRPAQRSRP